MIKRFLIIFMAFSLFGCAYKSTYKSTNEIMNSWMGSHISQVIQSWGPPTQITDDGAGGKIYIWSEQVIIPNALGTLFDGPTHKSPQHIIERVRMFYVRPNNIVYHWLAQK